MSGDRVALAVASVAGVLSVVALLVACGAGWYVWSMIQAASR